MIDQAIESVSQSVSHTHGLSLPPPVVPCCTHQHRARVVQVPLHHLPPRQPCIGWMKWGHASHVSQSVSRQPSADFGGSFRERRAWVLAAEEGAVGMAEGPGVVVRGPPHHHTCGHGTARHGRPEG